MEVEIPNQNGLVEWSVSFYNHEILISNCAAFEAYDADF